MLTASEFRAAVSSGGAGFLPPAADLDDDTWRSLYAHYRLLARWNPTIGLIGGGSAADAPARHYGESLAALGRIPAGPCMDLGSGGGFPGLVLAACLPKQPFVLVEARQRKAAFLSQAAAAMSLSNCQVLAEHWDGRRDSDATDEIARNRPFAALLSRAVNLQPWLDSLERLLAADAVWLAWGRGAEPNRVLEHWSQVDEVPFAGRRRLAIYQRTGA